MKHTAAPVCLALWMILAGALFPRAACADFWDDLNKTMYGPAAPALKDTVDVLRQLGYDADASWLPPEILSGWQEGCYTPGYLLCELMVWQGLGYTDADTGEWTPGSSTFFAFPLREENDGHLFTRFLQRVDAVVPEVAFSQYQETFIPFQAASEQTNPDEPVRNGMVQMKYLGVSDTYRESLVFSGFTYSGYSPLNCVSAVNEALAGFGCEKQIVIAFMSDEYAVLIYGTDEEAGLLWSILSGE